MPRKTRAAETAPAAEPTVTIGAAEYARLLEDARILDVLETPGLLDFGDGRPETLRDRGRIMLRSRKSVHEYIAYLERNRAAEDALLAFPRPALPRPARAARPARAEAQPSLFARRA